jgi:uncharacterized membrane protein YgcG
MIWLLLLLGLVILLIVIGAGAAPHPPRLTRHDRGSGIVTMDGAPIIEPNDNGFGLGDGFVHYDTGEDGSRFHPGGGSGGGAGASGHWDDGGDNVDGGGNDSGGDGGDGGGD